VCTKLEVWMRRDTNGKRKGIEEREGPEKVNKAAMWLR